MVPINYEQKFGKLQQDMSHPYTYPVAPVPTPLYLGPFLSTYNKIIESQRNGSRPIIFVPDVNTFLKTNFFFDNSESFQQTTPVPSSTPTVKKKESVFQPTLSTAEKDLALDLVAMSTQGSPSAPNAKESPKPVPRPIRSAEKPKWHEKRLKADQECLLEIKKRPVQDRFSAVGAVPVLSLEDTKMPFLKSFAKNILLELKPQALTSVEDDSKEEANEKTTTDEPNHTEPENHKISTSDIAEDEVEEKEEESEAKEDVEMIESGDEM